MCFAFQLTATGFSRWNSHCLILLNVLRNPERKQDIIYVKHYFTPFNTQDKFLVEYCTNNLSVRLLYCTVRGDKMELEVRRKVN